MIDLSEGLSKKNIEICKGYLERMSKMGMTLEIEWESQVVVDGVTTLMWIVLNYTQPEEVSYAYEELSKISPKFLHCFWKCSWSLQTRKRKINKKNSRSK
jgi:fructose-bisphosphate aldolase class II